MQTTARVPASPIEEKLLQLLRQVLGNSAVGVADNYYSTGQNSRFGERLANAVRNSLGIELTLQHISEASTVENLAVLVDTKLDEQRVAAIWTSVLGLQQVGLDDNFFDVGGESVLLAALQQRISKEFGLDISIAEMFEVPTVRLQTELTRNRKKNKKQQPSGVLALQPNGNRRSIFWLHYLSINLSKVIGDQQPFLYVALTAEDLLKLDKTPTLQSIAACLMRKILIAQPQGPYTIGGYCLGGILAYEIGSQLRAAGHDVALVVLVDPPNPTYIESVNTLKNLASYVGYAAHRAAKLGWRISLDYLGEHLVKFYERMLSSKPARTETEIAQRTIELAALKYDPKQYDGKVLLLLASEHPPHVNRLAGWQAVVPNELYVEYVDAHHRDLLKPKNVRSVADAIVTHLVSPTDDKSLSLSANTAG